ncbi:MAG: hypothetical protein J6S57_00510 [Alphaproteobacteria bacterium]|nr:hypothetical protein [Alphaproteobacteria bacterium]
MKNKTYKVSLISMMLVCAVDFSAHARVNVRNHATDMNAYNKMVMSQQQASVTVAPVKLPVAVDDSELEKKILDNTADEVSIGDLENCSMIYPNGVFKWGVPESGARKSQSAQCVAVVELRDVTTREVLARTTLAAGDVMKCNIDMFPESGWQSALKGVVLPADEAPTIGDVENVMNQEQKQNAGLKIAAGAILTGIAGNMLAPKEAGDTKLLGTSKDQLVSTAIAAAVGAGVTAASTYSGKVAGDTIKSTAVNAAAGAVVGNMAGGMSGNGESVLSIKKCTIKNDSLTGEFDCIAGNIDIVSDVDKKGVVDGKSKEDGAIYLVNRNHEMLKCTPIGKGKTCNKNEISLEPDADGSYCCSQSSERLINIKFNDKYGETNFFTKGDTFDDVKVYELQENDDDTKHLQEDLRFSDPRFLDNSKNYLQVFTADIPNGRTERGYAVFPNKLPKKFFGYKVKEWDSLKEVNDVVYYARNPNGSVGRERKEETKKGKTSKITFTPLGVDADDGSLVDFSNAGRMKSTLSGAAAGGALGGFAGYQGAKQEVQDRYVSSTREYNDSLTGFVCMTGARYLSPYNDYVEIPSPQIIQESE